VTIKDAGHMLQENQPLEVARVIDEFIRATRQ
jgi:pimeloyl-ACP methyl ester carboxylesterase